MITVQIPYENPEKLRQLAITLQRLAEIIEDADAKLPTLEDLIKREDQINEPPAPLPVEEEPWEDAAPVVEPWEDAVPVVEPPAPPTTVVEPPAPPTTVVEPPAPPVDLDSTGKPWDSELHASSKAKNADGTWRARRATGPKKTPPTGTEVLALINRVKGIAPEALEDLARSVGADSYQGIFSSGEMVRAFTEALLK